MDEVNGIAALGINWKMLISQGVNFLLLVLLLWWLLYKPVLKILNWRRERISQSIELAEKNKKEAEELQLKNQKMKEQAREDAKIYFEETKKQANEEAEKIKNKALDDAKEITKKANLEIKSDREKMIRGLKRELANLILIASGKLTRKTIKPEIQKQLVNDVISDLKSQNFQ